MFTKKIRIIALQTYYNYFKTTLGEITSWMSLKYKHQAAS